MTVILWHMKVLMGASPQTPSLTCDAARAGGQSARALTTCPYGRVWGRFQSVKGVFVKIFYKNLYKASPLTAFQLRATSQHNLIFFRNVFRGRENYAVFSKGNPVFNTV